MNNENCVRLCQTEIALVPSSPLTDSYNILTYIDQEKIDEDALRIIDIPKNPKRRSILPVSKFGLTSLSKTPTEESIAKKNKTEEMSSQTDLMVSPHILIEEEKAVISMSSSCQTFITCSPSISLTNIDPQSKNYLNHDNDEEKQLYKNVAEILTEIVHDVITIPQRVFKSAIMKPALGGCSTENSEWNTVISEGNAIPHSQVKDNGEDGMFDFIVDNSYKGDVLYCRSDDNVSVDSNTSEKLLTPSLDYTENTIEQELSSSGNDVIAAQSIANIGGNQSSMRLT